MFNPLIDDEFQKYLLILDMLCKKKKGESHTITISTLSAPLKMHRPFLKNAISEIIGEISLNNWEKWLSLSVEGEKIHFWIHPAFESDFLSIYFLKRSFGYQVLLQLLNNQSVTSSYLASTYTISAGTVSRKLAALKKYLHGFGLSIHLKRKNQLIGQEKNIRSFFYILIFLSYEEQDWPFKELAFSESRYLFQSLHPEIRKLTGQDHLKLFLYFSVVVTRLSQNHFLNPKELDLPVSLNPYFSLVDFTNKVQTQLATYLPVAKKKQKTEIENLYFIFHVLITYSVRSFDKVTNRSINFLELQRDEHNRFIHELCQKLNIKLSYQEYFFISTIILSSHTYFEQFETPYNPFINVIILRRMRRSYTKLYEATILIGEELLKDMDETLKNYLVDTYFILFCSIIGRKQRPLRIMIITKLSNYHDFEFKTMIRQATFRKIDFVDSKDDNVDLILSDTFLPHLEKQGYPLEYVDFSEDLSVRRLNLN